MPSRRLLCYRRMSANLFFFFKQKTAYEIDLVTGVQTCALPISSGVFRGIRSVVRQWKQAGSWCRWIVVSFDSGLFDPFQVANGINNPAGTFGPWAVQVNHAYVPSRFANARYADGAI